VVKLADIITLIIIAIIIFIFIKFRILRISTRTYRNYRWKVTPRRLKVSYTKFDGTEFFQFYLKKDQQMKMNYSITVENGSVTIHLCNRKGEIFTKNFTENEEGQFTFQTIGRLYSVELTGENTKGGCSIVFHSKGETLPK